jgi:glutamate--cysteine ligase
MRQRIDYRMMQRYATHYFRRAAKHPNQFRVGMETEHFCVRLSDGRRLPYESNEGPSIEGILDDLLQRRGGRPILSGEQIVGIDAEWGKITLEPGGQLEWASPPMRRIDGLLMELDAWLETLHLVLADHDAGTLSTAYDHETRLSDIPWVPKPRYDIMRRYYYPSRHISYAAMGLTAGIHVSFDYCDETDWQRKFRAMLLASPIAIALFANSPRERGLARLKAARPLSWLFMDPVRCRLPSAAFRSDFDLQQWTQWLLRVPQLLRLRGDLLESGSKSPFGCLNMDSARFPAAWRLHLSSIFTPVRSDGRLEVRSADMQRDEMIGAVPAFWTGLLYSQDALDQLLDRLAFIEEESTWLQLYHRACSLGLQDPRLLTLGNDLLRLAIHGLHDVDPDARKARRLLRNLHDAPVPTSTSLDQP